jgi:hypothetical protein
MPLLPKLESQAYNEGGRVNQLQIKVQITQSHVESLQVMRIVSLGNLDIENSLQIAFLSFTFT